MSSPSDKSSLKPAQPFRVFISYAREDAEHLTLFEQHLSTLVRQGWIEPWTDRLFKGGDTWEELLSNEILASDLILMLVSPAFMASDFIHRVELKTALERHAAQQVKLVPIMVRPMDLTDHALDTLQGLPRDRRPITGWPNPDEAWLSVVQGLRSVLVEPLVGRPPAIETSPSENTPTLPPTPRYEDDKYRLADEALITARAKLEVLELARKDEAEQQTLRDKIAELKRTLRDGETLQAGMRLDDRYKLLEVLGRGGYSTVWRALDEASGRLVAVKVLKPDALNSPTSRQRLASGMKAMLMLTHRHILQVKEPWKPERNSPGGRAPYQYSVLELAETDFQHFILDRKAGAKKPGLGEILRIVLEVAGALEHAHTHTPACIHRDVKPANILLLPDGTAKLTDFDLARLGDSTHGTKTAALGSFFYAAPELHEQGDVDRASPGMDVYSLGVTLLTGLRGKPPKQHPEKVEPQLKLPAELRSVLERALEPEPDKRYATMREFREALELAINAHLDEGLQQAEAQTGAGHWEKAVEHLEDLVRDFGWWPTAAVGWTALWIGWLKRLERAEDWHGALWLVDHGSTILPQGLDWAAERTRLEGLQRVEVDYSKALAALKKGDAVQARGLLLEVLRRRPDYRDSAQQLFIALSGVDPEALKASLVRADQKVSRLQLQLSTVEGETVRLKAEVDRQLKANVEKDGALAKQSTALKTLFEQLEASQETLEATRLKLEAAEKAQAEAQMALGVQESEQKALRATIAHLKVESSRQEATLKQAVEKAVEKAEQSRRRLSQRFTWAMIGLVGSLGLSSYLWLTRGMVSAPAKAPVAGETLGAPVSTPTPVPEDPGVALSKRLGITWISLPGDTFTMGSNDGESDEKPPHSVTVSSFKMTKTEITNAQYSACVKAGKCEALSWDDNKCRVWTGSEWKEGKLPESFRGDHQPVVCVDWFQARAYAKWVAENGEPCARLPTESEWEYASQGGQRQKYAGTSDEKEVCQYGNGADATAKKTNSSWTTLACDDGYEITAPVGKFKPNPFRLYDLTGNVWEWTEDCYHDSYKDAPSDGSAWMTGCREDDTQALRVARGGSWGAGPDGLRSSDRGRSRAGRRNVLQGFRLVSVPSLACTGRVSP